MDIRITKHCLVIVVDSKFLYGSIFLKNEHISIILIKIILKHEIIIIHHGIFLLIKNTILHNSFVIIRNHRLTHTIPYQCMVLFNHTIHITCLLNDEYCVEGSFGGWHFCSTV
jgi:hypothetical protein